MKDQRASRIVEFFYYQAAYMEFIFLFVLIDSRSRVNYHWAKDPVASAEAQVHQTQPQK
jgi:hypothetical protein